MCERRQKSTHRELTGGGCPTDAIREHMGVMISSLEILALGFPSKRTILTKEYLKGGYGAAR